MSLTLLKLRACRLARLYTGVRFITNACKAEPILICEMPNTFQRTTSIDWYKIFIKQSNQLLIRFNAFMLMAWCFSFLIAFTIPLDVTSNLSSEGGKNNKIDTTSCLGKMCNKYLKNVSCGSTPFKRLRLSTVLPNKSMHSPARFPCNCSSVVTYGLRAVPPIPTDDAARREASLKIKTSVNLITTADYISRFCANPDLPHTVQRAAIYIAKIALEMDIAPGRPPLSAAVVAIYMT
uniref:Transcription factor TFIIB cyclin-like domain-containing protein n=1 Tax=Glossina austeni TaxID=7395 RepID=A0A1A9UNQ5_GLOAU